MRRWRLNSGYSGNTDQRRTKAGTIPMLKHNMERDLGEFVEEVTPTIVTSGLVLHLDAGNVLSYSGSGSTWTDLSGSGNNGTLVNSPTYSSDNGGEFIFNGTNQYINTSGPNLSSSNHTIMGAARYNTTHVGQERIITSGSNNWLMGHYAGKTKNYFAGGFINADTDTGDTNYRIYTVTGNIAGDIYQLFVNNVSIASNNAGSYGPNGFVLGKYGSSYSNARMGVLLAYNRILTADEITKNYNILKGRYGL